MAKEIAILGSTGSIGRQTLEVVAAHPGQFRVAALAGARNVELLAEQVKRFRPRLAVLLDPEGARELAAKVSGLKVQVLAGEEGLLAAVCLAGVELVVAAMVGIRSLPAILAALEAGKDIALANKELLVAAGQVVMDRARSLDRQIIPVDSEHSAIFQCLRQGGRVVQVIITASGGPLREKTLAEMAAVTPEQALNHPTWVMGPKITVDSATLMNKGLEVIEARHLFNLDYDQIEVLIHPQSVVHALVRYSDGALFAHLGPADMRLPIQYALTWPERWDLDSQVLDLAALGHLDFSRPDLERFPCLELACRAGRAGGTYPAVLSAADEVAVQYFLARRIPLTAISQVIARVLEEHRPVTTPDLEQILAADAWARRRAGEVAEGFCKGVEAQ
ncbi:1-deoxy-D-xylulose 5-phosphate reductoisomerase [Moorella glycerini]|uniref:1-deoxy-D-xylulose 5-phosphate reductoisomerase n=1 Tax=Neomoorella stamsii TaxID=1266720 RepID=A0A9X7IZW9_9FIRM|nr:MULTISPECIES: 1-deoxy-D-xylulose-5-phosphate reductoisomerase [Moorella]PRR68645.1 1-deoxy-D-xylulose 5-phosphate reductoisomerase [Moorella stamsii]CEP69016.1 1-deoxy-D-xylulose 5-phosphate reductoisomerase [Moorella glycerini]